MPINVEYKAPYFHECSYHVFNRSVFGQQLFYHTENYAFFLDKMQSFLSDLVIFRAWSLIPNHFHLFITTRPFEEIQTPQKLEIELMPLLTTRFKNFFICYSNSLKKERGIKTNVFAQKYRHKAVLTDEQTTNLYNYIHHNPLHHGLTGDWETYPWSSYRDIVTGNERITDVKLALEWFGGRESFIQQHRMNATRFFDEFEIKQRRRACIRVPNP